VGTPDTLLYKADRTKPGRATYDSGLIIPLHYDIVDGKRIFRKYAGVNNSAPNI